MSDRPVHILNGPNLNLLGLREPEIYGATTLAEIEETCRSAARGPIVFEQTNFEGQMIELIHAAWEGAGGIIINPAGWTFTSVAILDALKMFDGPIIELHISNIHTREAIYHSSLVSPVVTSVICGLGAAGYPLALRAIYELIG